MSRPGPVGKPISQHRVEGTFRNDRHGGRLELPAARPDAPEHLSEGAQAEWARLVEILFPLGVLSDGDRESLAKLCQAEADYWTFRKIAEAANWQMVGSKGQTCKHWAVEQMNKSFDQAHKLRREFGLTPSSRAGINAPSDAPGDDDERDLLGFVG